MQIRKVVLEFGNYGWFLFYKINIPAIQIFYKKQKEEKEFL